MAVAGELAGRLSGGAPGKSRKPRAAQVRSAFIYRDKPEDSPPPATVLLGNRAKDGVDIKLALSLLWAAGGSGEDPEEPGLLHSTRFVDRDWAELLGLDKPDSAGKRRIAAARQRLADARLIDLERRPGEATRIVLLREDASGAPYSSPGEPLAGGRAEGKYHQLKAEFWTNGWMAGLSVRAVITLLTLIHMTNTGKPGDLAFVSPRFRHDHFGFSEETFYNGASELCAFGLVEKRRERVRRPFHPDSNNFRDKYLLDLTKLGQKTPADQDDLAVLILQDRRATDAVDRLHDF
jgi:hypothetical protein